MNADAVQLTTKVVAITRQQAVDLQRSITRALSRAERSCSQRCMSIMSVILCGRDTNSKRDGGRVTSRSYKFGWSTTTAKSSVSLDGQVEVNISRSSNSSVAAPVDHWNNITTDGQILSGGGIVAIRRKTHWECLNKEARKVCVAVRIKNKAVAARFGEWEHGKTIAACKAETNRKAAIIAMDAETAIQRQRRDRAARILTKIGCNTHIQASMATAAGACSSGIAAFAARIGKQVTDTVTLTEIAAVEPVWAVRIARTLVRA